MSVVRALERDAEQRRNLILRIVGSVLLLVAAVLVLAGLWTTPHLETYQKLIATGLMFGLAGVIGWLVTT